MSSDRQYVLCFGKDAVLSDTRRQLLHAAGYAVVSSSEESTVKMGLERGDASLLVLCHTLEDKEMKRVIEFHRELGSSTYLLCLNAGKSHIALDCGETCNTHQGPAAFLAAVEHLAGESRRHK
jgi:hypothetical protein